MKTYNKSELGASAEERGAPPSHHTSRVSIAVSPVESYRKHFELLTALQDVLFVRFHPCREDDIGAFRFAILWETTDEIIARAQQSGTRCLVFRHRERDVRVCSGGEVAFSDVSDIAQAIRGQRFVENEPLETAPIAGYPGRVLATRSGLPIWIRCDSGAASVDYLAIEPGLLNPGTLLREQLHPHSVSRLVPLLHFVREASGEQEWDSGPRHACFVLDDPSLYRPSYGCVNFAQLATHAARHGYHVAVATIPLDTWWVHRDVASVFRSYPKQMSLVIHGNNHTRLEMWRHSSQHDHLPDLAQAVRRFARLERQHGLPFSKVLEAPHGVIAHKALETLVTLGYEGALFTPSQFVNGNRQAGCPTSFGFNPVDVTPHGGCLIPRVVMSKDWRADTSIAAFLHQPIVLAGHHQDFFAGLELLSEFSAFVNRLGNVRWSNLTEIARSRFISRREGSTWVVRLGARAVECPTPSGITQVVIERPWIRRDAEPMKISGATDAEEPRWFLSGPVSEPLILPLEAGGTIRIESPPLVALNPDSVANPPQAMWPVVRKVLVEVRDRFYPFLPEVIRHLVSENGYGTGPTRH